MICLVQIKGSLVCLPIWSGSFRLVWKLLSGSGKSQTSTPKLLKKGGYWSAAQQTLMFVCGLKGNKTNHGSLWWCVIVTTSQDRLIHKAHKGHCDLLLSVETLSHPGHSFPTGAVQFRLVRSSWSFSFTLTGLWSADNAQWYDDDHTSSQTRELPIGGGVVLINGGEQVWK